MNNFDMIVISEKKENILVVMKTSEPPFDYLAEIEASLKERRYIGVVMIDELLHSGNTNGLFMDTLMVSSLTVGNLPLSLFRKKVN